MSEKKPTLIKTLIIGIAASVIGGIILIVIPSLKSTFLKLLGWIWSGLVLVWNAILTSYPLPGWILIILFLLSFVGIKIGMKNVYLKFRPEEEEYKSYTEDFIYKVKCRWSWVGNDISNICCYCPHCDVELAPNYDDYLGLTEFSCENCNKVVARMSGNKYYAKGAVKREVERRIRTGEYKKHKKINEVSK